LYEPTKRDTALQALNQCAIVLSEGMRLEQLDHVYRGRKEAKLLFPDVAWLHESLSTSSFPGQFVRNFGVRQAVDILDNMPVDQLESAWRMGTLNLPGLFRWFESQQIEIFADDPSLQGKIRKLPLCPMSGELRPLADLYIAGRFEDPLKLAGIVDLDAIGGRRQFLRDLGVQELTFDTYIRIQLPHALAKNPDLPSDARHHLVRLLAGRLGEFRDDHELQSLLRQLPLIPCMDGSFRAAELVYSTREVIALLGEQVHIAEPVSSKAVKELHRWLGVREQPTATDLAQTLSKIGNKWGGKDAPLDVVTLDIVHACWQELNLLIDRELIAVEVLEPLKGMSVIPDGQNILRHPKDLFFADSADLAGLFTGLDDYLLSPESDMARAATILGVRQLTQAAQLQLKIPKKQIEDRLIQQRIIERRTLIARVVKAESADYEMTFQADFVDNLRVLKVDYLQVHHSLKVGKRTLSTVPKSVSVQFESDSKTLYVTDGKHPLPWTAISREIAMSVKRKHPVGGLAVGIKEVLTASSYAEARQGLDELGYH
jgi:hypothetical protein